MSTKNKKMRIAKDKFMWCYTLSGIVITIWTAMLIFTDIGPSRFMSYAIPSLAMWAIWGISLLFFQNPMRTDLNWGMLMSMMAGSWIVASGTQYYLFNGKKIHVATNVLFSLFGSGIAYFLFSQLFRV